jgi:hypothetical protein
VHQLLGILGLAGFAIAVLAAAAFSTWLIVKLFPAPEDREAERLEEERKQAAAPAS